MSRGPGGQSSVRSTPVVSSPGRQSLQSQYTPASQYSGQTPVYSQASSRSYAHQQASTTYNPGYQQQEQPVNRRYLSEGELIGDMSVGVQGVIPSTSAGHLQVSRTSNECQFLIIMLLRTWQGHLRDTLDINTILPPPTPGHQSTPLLATHTLSRWDSSSSSKCQYPQFSQEDPGPRPVGILVVQWCLLAR